MNCKERNKFNDQGYLTLVMDKESQVPNYFTYTLSKNPKLFFWIREIRPIIRSTFLIFARLVQQHLFLPSPMKEYVENQNKIDSHMPKLSSLSLSLLPPFGLVGTQIMEEEDRESIKAPWSMVKNWDLLQTIIQLFRKHACTNRNKVIPCVHDLSPAASSTKHNLFPCILNPNSKVLQSPFENPKRRSYSRYHTLQVHARGVEVGLNCSQAIRRQYGDC